MASKCKMQTNIYVDLLIAWAGNKTTPVPDIY